MLHSLLFKIEVLLIDNGIFYINTYLKQMHCDLNNVQHYLSFKTNLKHILFKCHISLSSFYLFLIKNLIITSKEISLKKLYVICYISNLDFDIKLIY